MKKEEYRFDLSIFKEFERYQRENGLYQDMLVLADKQGRPAIIRCSAKPDPARWSIVSDLFDVSFLTHRELQDYIKEKGLRQWTEKDDERSGMVFSNLKRKSIL